MLKGIKTSPEAQSLMELVFSKDKNKQAVTLRRMMKDRAVYCSNASSHHSPPGNEWRRSGYLGDGANGFIAGWKAAGGGNLWMTWHLIGQCWAFMFWRENPEKMIAEAIQAEYPALLVRSVQET